MILLLVGLEPMNGYQEGKNITTNDQLPSTDTDLSVTTPPAAAPPSSTIEQVTITTTAEVQLPPPVQQSQQADMIVASSVPTTTASVTSVSVPELSSITPISMNDPMEIDDAPSNIDLSSMGVDTSDVPQVDLESDVLREFLESETTDLSATDDVGIEQMLMA